MIISGKYEVTEKVGQGGMGVVYRVRHLDLDTVLALKILPRDLAQDNELVERFRREARVMARLSHANIVRVFDFAKDGETYYLIMEFLAGKNLRQILTEHMNRTQQPLPLKEVLRVGGQIADALAYAHGQNPSVIHRDIKPSNIIIEDTTARAVVTDFGIAKLMGESQSELTHTGLFVGTVKYCAPEQLRHDPDIDARADIYALGMVLYELITGKQFFAGLKDHEVIGRVLYEKGDNAVQLPGVPEDFTRIVARAIARDRNARYATARELATDLQECARARAEGAAPVPDEATVLTGDVDAEDIDAQIRALEKKRLQRLAEQARDECRTERAAAEAAGSRADAADAFAEAVARQAEGDAHFEAEQHEEAAGAYHDAAAAFDRAGTIAADTRRTRAATQARDTARDLAGEAAALDAATLAPEPWQRAEERAAAGESLLAANDFERAAAEFGEAAEAFGSAIAAVRRARELQAIQAELPALAEARERAEAADAPALAGDAFAAAARDQERLDKALSEGQLTLARELLATVRDAFAASTLTAVQARATRATVEARERMAAMRDAAQAAVGEEPPPRELASAASHEVEGVAAERAADWESARTHYLEAARFYEQARKGAEAHAVAVRARRALEDAEGAMRAAREHAESAGAVEGAPTLFGRAAELALRAAAEAGGDDVVEATNDFRLAADQYEHAAQLAERRTRRAAIERRLSEAATARSRAEGLGADKSARFAAAESARAEAEKALAADDMTTAATAAETAGAAYDAAIVEIEERQHLAAADEALGRLAALVAAAGEIDAPRAASEEWASAERVREQAAECRRAGNWAEVLRLVADAEPLYVRTLESVVGAVRAAATAAREAASAADAGRKDLKEADRTFQAAERHQRAGERADAVRAFREATAVYREAVEETKEAAGEARSQAEEARRAAQTADAERRAGDEWGAARKSFAAAEAAAKEGRFAAAVSEFDGSARLFATAAESAARAKERDDALALRKEAEDARAAAERVEAAKLVATQFSRADDQLANGDRALASGDCGTATVAFRDAATAFQGAVDAATRLIAERAARAVREEVERLRAARDPAALGFFARRKVVRADAMIGEAKRALEQGDAAAAQRRFEEAREVLASVAAPAAEAAPTPAAEPAPADQTVVGDGTVVTDRTVVVERPQERARGKRRAAAAAAVPQPVPIARPGRSLLPIAGGVGAAAIVGTLLAWSMLGTSEEPKPPTPQATGPIARVGATAQPPEVQRTRVAATAAPPPIEVAVVEATPPPPLRSPGFEATPRPPELRSVSPDEATVQLASGETATFRIELAEADGVTYEWKVGNRVLADADGPTVRIPVEDARQEVAVTARDALGREVSRQWQLAALPRATQTAAPGPLRLVSSLPDDPSLEVTAGGSLRLQVTPSDTGERLAYAWTVDGRPVGRDAPRLDWKPAAADEGETRTIRVSVTSPSRQTASREWSVRVPAAPVTIVSQQPRTGTTVPLGSEAELAVVARAGASEGGLTYRWSVNGAPVEETGPRLAYRVDRPQSDVQVTVAAPGRQAAVGRWRILGETAATPRPPAVPTVAPVPPGDPRREVEAWITAYRDAFQSKNTDRLVQLGAYTPDAAAKLSGILAGRQNLQVSIQGPEIEIRGDNEAVVTMKRVDTYEDAGREVSQSAEVKKTLTRERGMWKAR